MAQAPVSTPAAMHTQAGGARYLPWLLLLFAGSGCSALIYEIAWYQMLQLVIGSTAVSLGVLLATYMSGLCIGSLALPRWLGRHRREHPLRVYALLEMGTGVLGLLGLWFIPLVDRAYIAGAEHGLPSMLLRGLLCGLCLLPPTILMGASLPAITSWLESTPRGVAWWGLLYGGNIAGAVIGCLLAGYYVLRVFNLDTAVVLAVVINLVVAALGLLVAQRAPASAALDAPDDTSTPHRERAVGGSRARVMLVIALSGCSALGAEVVWTRLMGLLLGATVYTFSLILAVFLVGLGLGSGLGAWLVGRVRSAREALGWCQWALALTVAWAAWMIAASLPYWPINPQLSTSPWFIFQIDLVRCVWTILPAAILWGASFPLALAAAQAAAPAGADSGRLVGEVYAANTLGAIVGALAFSLFLIPWIGTQHCESLLIALAAMGGLLLTFDLVGARTWRPGAALAAFSIVCIVLILTVRNVPGELIAYGREIAEEAGQSQILFTGEGRNASIAISRWNDGTLQFHIDGKVEASTDPADMKLQRMLGHVPALLHGPNLKSVLVVGFGAGVTAGSFTLYPSVKNITICELEPLVPPTSTRYFSAQNYDVMNDPRTHIVYDDARHFVLTDPHKYDLITSDPIHPWVKGSATLYTRNYFQMVRDHLNPGGMVSQWVPLYETDAAAVKSEIASFFAVFPNGTIWANTVDGGGYDTFLLGSNSPYQLNVDQLQAKLDSPEYAKVEASMQEVGMGSAYAIASTYAGDATDLKPWLANAQINTDSNLRLQYLAGLALNEDNENAIFDDILQYRRFPANLIVGSPQSLAPLEQVLSSNTEDSTGDGGDAGE